MSDVFVSYRREDESSVAVLVAALRDSGLSVWWDRDIALNTPWESTIEHQLEIARVAIVAWSREAVISENVKSEARRARQKGKLLQVFLEDCEPPLFFGERQGLSLNNWTGDTKHSKFVTLLSAIQAVKAGKRPTTGVGYKPKKRTSWVVRSVASLALAIAVIGVLLNTNSLRDWICSSDGAPGFYCISTQSGGTAVGTSFKEPEAVAWSSALDRNSRSVFEQFLFDYPDSEYSNRARERLNGLHYERIVLGPLNKEIEYYGIQSIFGAGQVSSLTELATWDTYEAREWPGMKIAFNESSNILRVQLTEESKSFFESYQIFDRRLNLFSMTQMEVVRHLGSPHRQTSWDGGVQLWYFADDEGAIMFQISGRGAVTSKESGVARINLYFTSNLSKGDYIIIDRFSDQ